MNKVKLIAAMVSAALAQYSFAESKVVFPDADYEYEMRANTYRQIAEQYTQEPDDSAKVVFVDGDSIETHTVSNQEVARPIKPNKQIPQLHQSHQTHSFGQQLAASSMVSKPTNTPIQQQNIAQTSGKQNDIVLYSAIQPDTKQGSPTAEPALAPVEAPTVYLGEISPKQAARAMFEDYEVRGAHTIRRADILDLLKANDIANHPEKIQALREHMLKNYAEQGKESAQINFSGIVKDGKNVMLVSINEGKTTRLKETVVHVDGQAHSVHQSVFSSKRLSREKLFRAAQSQLESYRNNGYMNAEIKDITLTPVGDNGLLKRADIYIERGQHFTVGTTQFNMADNLAAVFPPEKLTAINKIQNGKPFSADTLSQTEDGIKVALMNNGYIYHQVQAKHIDKDDVVDIVFDINADNPVKIGTVSVSGNSKTRADVILKEMRQQSGETFDMSKMQRTKERLMQTGFFSAADIEVKPVQQADGTVDTVNLDVQVKERRTGSVQAQLGYIQNDGMTIGAAIEDRNIFGSGKGVSASAQYNKYHRNASVSYHDEHFKGDTSLDLEGYGTIYKSDSDTYKTQRAGVRATFGLPLNEYNKLYVGGAIEHMGLTVYERAPERYKAFVSENGEENKFSGVNAKLNIGWGINKTNDAYWPTKGYFANANLETTIPGSKLGYYKARASYRYYFPLGEQTALMLGARIAYGNSYGKTKTRSNGGLPFFENFNGGGYSDVMVRGFENSTLGAKTLDRENGIVSYGGNKAVGLNAEIFTPIPFISKEASENVRLSAFVDAGSVWDGKTYSGAPYKTSHHSNMRNEFRASAGVGISWNSPIGPVKFTYAQPLRKRDSDQIQRFQFQLGWQF